MTLLGIDVGTGGTRAVIIDEHGRLLGAATADHVPFASPQPGWSEQDPRDWWSAASQAVRGALTRAGLGGDAIGGVGFSGQMHGAVLLDEHDEVVRPALLWNDQRTSAQCTHITERVGRDRLIEWVSNPALTGFTAPKLLWVRDEEPALFARVRHLLLPKDYVRFRLTGDRATDVADASGTLLFDVTHRRWSDAMMHALNLDPAILPRAFESPHVTGTVSAAGAEATGLRVGTPVVAGGGDQSAGGVGMGIVLPGVVSATIGTSGVVFAATDRPARDPHGRVHTFCHAVPDRWHVMGVTLAAGYSLRWFRDQLCDLTAAAALEGRDPYDLLTDEAARVPPGADDLLWAPYLMGERTPHIDPYARAALVGLSAIHTRGHIVRAILEGVAFSLQDTFGIFAEMQVPVTRVRLGGGGAKSPLWRQVQADVYGHDVEIVEAEEGAAYGAALLAGVGTHVWPSVDAACSAVVRVAHTVTVDPPASRVLRERYAAFRQLYPTLKNFSSAAPRVAQR